MNVRIVRGTEVTRPETTPLASSILDHATVVNNEKFALRNNAGLWPSYNCIDTLVPTPMCPDPLLDETGGFKEFSFPEWVPGFDFVYRGAVQCRAIGLDREDMKAELVRVFDRNEGKGIERALLANRFVATDSPADDDPNTPEWGDPVDLTPGSSITLASALAILEGYAAAHYAGVPTIHMPRAAASLLGSDKIQWMGGKAFTRLGSKVAIGGGYDDGDTTQTGIYDLYATGEVYVERGLEVDVTDVMVIPGDGSGIGSGENGLMDNTVVGLVERAYRVGVDCFVAKATGGVAGGGGGFGA